MPDLDLLTTELARLREENRWFKSILDSAPVLLSAKDLQGNILFVSGHFSVLNGLAPQDYVNKNVFELFPKEIAQQLWDNDLLAQRSEKPIVTEEQVYHKDGLLHTYQTTKFQLADANDQTIGTCAVSFDISDLKSLEYDVVRDPLTGIYNRRMLEDCLNAERQRAAREGKTLAFAMLDLDGFKQFNDQHGHQKGDELLIATANVMQNLLRRPTDFCFRIGGDEFAVLFPTDSAQAALQLMSSVINRLRVEIGDSFEPAQGFGISIGIRTVEPHDPITNRQVFFDADKALYRCKAMGKGQCQLFEP